MQNNMRNNTPKKGYFIISYLISSTFLVFIYYWFFNNNVFFWLNNKFLANFLNGLTNFLDSLSLLEESAFFHILIMLTMIFIMSNIYSVLFGNEIIRIFKLEEKFPKLNKFFQFLKFQRYYLILNLVYFIVVVSFVLFLDILILF